MKFIGIASLVSVTFALGCAVDATTPTDEPDSVGSATEELGCKNALSPTEEKTVLKLVDDICGDTWCSGDNNFAFRRLSCSAPSGAAAGSCTLALTLLPREGTAGYPRRFNRVCVTPDFTGFSSLVYTASNGYQLLQTDYYLALTDCITSLEATLPR